MGAHQNMSTTLNGFASGQAHPWRAEYPDMTYGVLFVCTGNICRSPTAEAVFRHEINAAGLAGRLRADSAGTHGYHIGAPPDPRSIAIAEEGGVDMAGLRARQLVRADYNAFDLILAMDDGHMAHMRRMAPAGARARLGLLLDFAPGAGRRDVPDPYYDGTAAFIDVLALIRMGVDGLLNHLRKDVL